MWKWILAKAGLDYRKFHTIRHTVASILISRGERLLYIKEFLGHSSIQITVDVYGHMLPNSNREAVNTLDDPTATIRDLSASDQKEKVVTL